MSDDQIAAQLVVLGAGVMGVSITTLALGHGLPVLLVDVDATKLDQAPIDVAKQLRLAQLMGARSAEEPIGELVTSTSVHDAAEATAVIEAITEVAELKSKALSELSAVVRPGTLLVSNTSSIPIDELAESEVARKALGPHIFDRYVELKRKEWDEYRVQLSEWELQRYLSVL